MAFGPALLLRTLYEYQFQTEEMVVPALVAR